MLESTLAEFVRQSNMIEGEPTVAGHPLYDDHLRIAERLAEGGSVEHPLHLHRELMHSQPWIFPGEYRQCGVRVGGSIKMDPVDVRPRMNQLLDRLEDGPGDWDLEDWCWDLHFEFEHIHPFIDGNGRTGRLWMNAVRVSYGLPWLIVWYEERFAYYRMIEEWEHRNA